MTDWARGDRAMCVSGPPWDDLYPGPALYSVHVVQEVIPGIFPAPEGAPFLEFSPWPGLCYWHKHFVKVDPGAPAVRRQTGARIPEPVW